MRGQAAGVHVPAWVLTMLLAAALLWPALLNRQAFLFDDTSAYVRGFDAAFVKATGVTSHWTSDRTQAHVAEARPVASLSAEARQPAAPPDTPRALSGRSIYYGGLIYLSDWIGGFWLLVGAQAALFAFAAVRVLRNAGGSAPPSGPIALGVLGFVALATPAGYFVGLVMPDIFGGLAILAAASLLFRLSNEGAAWRAFWAGLLAAAMLFHSANLILVVAMLVCAAVIAGGIGVRLDRAGLLAVAAAIGIALAGEAAFSLAVRKATGHAPIRPPFVTARLVADGPGRAYLDRTCPASGFAVCAYRDRLPLGSDPFLWSPSGVFSAAPPADQDRLSREDARFALAVFRERPADTAIAAITAVGRQLRAAEMAIFNYPPFRIAGFRAKLPADTIVEVARTRAYANTMPVRYLELIDLPVAGVSLLFMGWWAWRHRRTEPRLAGFALTVAAAVLANAAIVGTLSTPHGRYQNRLIWVLPLLALSLAARRRPVREAG